MRSEEDGEEKRGVEQKYKEGIEEGKRRVG